MNRQFDFAPVDRILDSHPRSELSTIAILQDIQEHYHYLPREVFPYVAKAIGVGEARLYGVATFYENFSLEPKGKYVIRCCDGTACHVRGSIPILERLLRDGPAGAGGAPGLAVHEGEAGRLPGDRGEDDHRRRMRRATGLPAKRRDLSQVGGDSLLRQAAARGAGALRPHQRHLHL